MSSTDTPPSFPPSSDSGGEEGDVRVRENPQVLRPRERNLSRNEVTAERTRGQTRQAQPPSVRTRDGARSKAMAAITVLDNFSEALLTEAAGAGVTSRSRRRSSPRFSGKLATTSVSRRRALHTQGSLIKIMFPVGIHIGLIKSTPQDMAELRDSKYKEYWIRMMKSPLEGYATAGTFAGENIP